MIIACVQITLNLVDKWPHVSNTYSLWMQMQNWSFSVHIKHTHADKSHWNPKSFNSQIWETRNSHCSTRKVWVELNSQTETHNSHISTRNSQLELATRTRNSHSQLELATRNSQNTSTLICIGWRKHGGKDQGGNWNNFTLLIISLTTNYEKPKHLRGAPLNFWVSLQIMSLYLKFPCRYALFQVKPANTII